MIPSTGDIKNIYKVFQEAGKIELYEKILEMKERLLSGQEENHGLKKDKERLTELLKIKDNLELKDNLYWIRKEEKSDGPFCTRCWDKNKELIRIPIYNNQYSYNCPECKSSIVNPNHINQLQTHRSSGYF